MQRCPLLAHSGHGLLHRTCPLLGVKRTCPFALHMSANDPKRTFGPTSNLQIDRYDVFVRGRRHP